VYVKEIDKEKNMKLWELAQVQIGDDMNLLHITLSAYDKGDYLLMRDKVTPERIKRHFGASVKGDIITVEIPQSGRINFFMYNTVPHSPETTAIEQQNKIRSSQLLNMDI
jgi:hypothetical protein